MRKMAKFIELTRTDCEKVLLNVNCIESVQVNGENVTLVFISNRNEPYFIMERYYYVKKALKSSLVHDGEVDPLITPEIFEG